ncbi:MAG TPA: hypothetical protein VMJ90_00040 [Anaerolineales bacterium]|nr:hypothetical protein [Anaerolineales bacterium]
MKKSFRFTFMSIALVGAYLLSACGGGPPQSSPSEAAQKIQAKEIVFTGIVEQINGNQWIVSGQAFPVDPAAATDNDNHNDDSNNNDVNSGSGGGGDD